MKKIVYALAALLTASLLPILVVAAEPSPVDTEKKAEAITTLDEMICTTPAMQSPLQIQFNPKKPQQPLPAQDGAAFLKNVPGMSVIRKGGTDGDPMFRGMAGSRLGILLDGENILGGCGNRMDPPTAYVFPETYDRITILKGPQTVLYGPSNSAGVVLFERENRRFEKPGLKLSASVMGGSFGRHDEVIDVTAGIPLFYLRATGTNSHSNDYKDGDGHKVHSRYTRWSVGGALGWTPDKDTKLEVTTTQSDGEAAYADRTMDGVKFARQNYGIKFERKNLAPWLEKMEAQAYYNYIDHVMDNYSLRSIPITTNFMVSNPDRKTVGGKLALTLRPGDTTKLVLGIDGQLNKHTIRSTMNQKTLPYESLARTEDAKIAQKSAFGEFTLYLGESDRLIAGLRGDLWDATDKRQTLRLGMMTVANPTANMKRSETLGSGFARYEHDFGATGTTFYAGIGHNERFPDYWELVSASKEGPTAVDLSAFNTTNAEKTTQLDIGVTWKSASWSGFVAGFYNKIDDFILIQSGVARTAPVRTVTIVRNVDAKTFGGEAGVRYEIVKNLRFDTSISYVHGQNDTENRPLAQMPPFEGRLGLSWDNKTWSLGTLVRLVAAQTRYAVNEGNIVGQDIGRTSGFAVFSINGGWVPLKGMLLAVGIDNLFDKTYAEHISRSGAMVAGYDQTTRVNEPGRMFWGKLSYSF